MINIGIHLEVRNRPPKVKGCGDMTGKGWVFRYLEIDGLTVYLPRDHAAAVAVADQIRAALDVACIDPIAAEYKRRPAYWAERCAGMGMSDTHIAIGEYLGGEA